MQHASPEKQAFIAALDFNPPAEYVAFLVANSFIKQDYSYCYSSEAGWLAGITGVLAYNEDYQATEFYPGYFLIGANRGCEVFAIEKATGYFVRTMFVGHDEASVIVVGKTWAEFLQRLSTDDIYD